jgi:hypothetical protein
MITSHTEGQKKKKQKAKIHTWNYESHNPT